MTLCKASVYYKGKPIFRSTSHVTCGFDRVIKTGFKGLKSDIVSRLEDIALQKSEKVFLEAMLSCLNSFTLWHKRNFELLKQKIESASGNKKEFYQSIYENAENVPENQPQNFREAVQSLWFMFCFLRLCGNWPGIGRIDVILGDYLKNDLDSRKITLEEAKEVLMEATWEEAGMPSIIRILY